MGKDGDRKILSSRIPFTKEEETRRLPPKERFTYLKEWNIARTENHGRSKAAIARITSEQ